MHALQVETISCPGCGNDSHDLVMTLTERDHYPIEGLTDHAFALVRCVSCQLVYVNPRLGTELEKQIYRDSIYGDTARGDQDPQATPVYQAYFSRLPTQLQKFTGIVRAMERLVPTQQRERWLDVGCSFGHLVECANHRGWTASGLELATESADYARNTLKLTVEECELQKHAFEPGSFQVISALEYFEHSQDLQADVATVFSLLQPGGYVVATVPNLNSVKRVLRGKAWSAFHPIGHLQYFTYRTMASLFERHGFVVDRWQNLRGTCTYLGSQATWQQPRSWARPLLGWVGRDESLTMIARKPLHEQSGSTR